MIYATYDEALMAMNSEQDQPNVQGLEPVQVAQYTALESIVESFGQFDWSTGPSGSHYTPADLNPFINEGLVCSNCAFYEAGLCEIVQGNIEPNAICKFWIIPASKLGA